MTRVNSWNERDPLKHVIVGRIDSWLYLDEMYLRLQDRVFDAGYDALVCPALTTTAIPADLGHPGAGPPVTLGDQLDLVMTYPFNALGRLPVLAVPVGFAPSTGAPVGVQIVGPAEQDQVPFRVGAALEAADGPLFDRARPELPSAP